MLTSIIKESLETKIAECTKVAIAKTLIMINMKAASQKELGSILVISHYIYIGKLIYQLLNKLRLVLSLTQ